MLPIQKLKWINARLKELMINYERLILALDDVELEKLVRQWANQQKNKYDTVKRFAGSGDMGRDVVGFYSPLKHDGGWDNYQCKQYNKPLPTDQGVLEIGKILYFAFQKEFTVPKKYYFVAPKGVNRNLEGYICKPEKFKEILINEWAKFCKDKIIRNTPIPLNNELKEFIQSYDFSTIDVIDIDKIVSDEHFKHILVDWFGGDLSPAPEGVVPKKIQSHESKYIQEILTAYADHDGIDYSHIDDLENHINFKVDLEVQRERYFSADAFKRFYRDNTVGNVLATLEKQVFNGVYDTTRQAYPNGYDCMCTVMSQAANITPSGKLAVHAQVDVKQGYCHHFVNGGKLKWTK
ncbi:MAG: hypothetical protein ACI9YH_001756 [Colwellia sp.]|jgi:hypothetical protein